MESSTRNRSTAIARTMKNTEQQPAYFVHERGMCESVIGAGSRVWANAHVMKNAHVGNDCNIGEGSFVESGAHIGNGCTIKNGVSIWDGVTLEGDVFVGPNAVFTNDMTPRAKSVNSEFHLVRTIVQRGASIGANATIVCGITLGEYCMIGAGAVVTKDVPAFALVYGNPARVQGWVSIKGSKLHFNEEGIATDADGNIYQLKNNKVSIVDN